MPSLPPCPPPRRSSMRPVVRLLPTCLAVALTALVLPLSASPLAAQRSRPRPAPAASQPAAGALTAADSLLLYRVLQAEDRRDGSDAALREGVAHRDARIRRIAMRAVARIADSTFAERATLGTPADRPLPTWPVPEWDARYRGLRPITPCADLVRALGDSAVHVRVRAITLAGGQSGCRRNSAMRDSLLAITTIVPLEIRQRRPGLPTAAEAAAAVTSLARLDARVAAPAIARLQRHQSPWVREGVATAAAHAGDTAVLQALRRDQDDNVRERAVAGLFQVLGPNGTAVYTQELQDHAPQVVLAAAAALESLRDTTVRPLARTLLARWEARTHASERDVRNALRRLAGLPGQEPWAPGRDQPLPMDVVALALGEPRSLQVIMGRLYGGQSFTVELRGDVAPIMAARVLQYARDGYYNGTQWHRVEPAFVVQGGGPGDDEYRGGPRFFVDELSTIPHPRGSIGMSTRGHDTGDAQWFINLRDNARLARDYTVFGVITAGMESVDALLPGDEIYVVREAPRPAATPAPATAPRPPRVPRAPRPAGR